MQGLNITVTIKRSTEGDNDNIIGGAVPIVSTVYTGLKARISSIKPSEDARIQGLESSKIFNCVIHPASYDIRESDKLYPESGQYTGIEFRIVGVQIDSIDHTVDNRAHISLRLLRETIARTLQ